MVQGGASLEARLAVLEQQLLELRRDLEAQKVVLGGPPWDRSLRGRMHTLWDERNAARLAAQTLEEAKSERLRAQRDRKLSESRRRANQRWRFATAVAVLSATYPYLAHLAGWH